MKTFQVKVPFIGYKMVEVEIENEEDFDSEAELEDAAWEQAEEQVYNDAQNSDFDRFEVEERVEAITNDRYGALIYKFDKEIEDITIGQEEEEDDTE